MVHITAEQKERFLHEGYLVVENVVGQPEREAAIDAIEAFLGVDADDPDTWYKHRLEGHGIVPLHHAQALWDLRQLPPIHDIYAQMYGDERLWVTFDRVSFKAPGRGWQDPVSMNPVHWDCDPRTWRQLSIQGLVYLRDTDAAQGAFCCVPRIYQNLPEWLAAHAEDADVRRPDVSGERMVSVGGPAGSLVMFHRLMPHSSGPNEGDRPRLVQYVAMNPVGSEDERAQRVSDYQANMPPQWAIRQHVAGQQMPEPGAPARLTPLGRKLVGLDPW